MANFSITLSDGETLTYSTDPATLVDSSGNKVDLSRFAYQYVDVPADVGQIPFSQENPVIGKSSAPKVLKIQLGLGCNYACSYCSQGGQKEEATSSKDAETFDLDFVTEVPGKIELWGGEPLLYWKKIEALVAKIDAKWPGVPRSIVSNGSLLTREKVDWLYDHGFSVALSHDGPGQSLRGPDPLDDMEMRLTWQYLFDKFGERAAVNAVLTAKNFDLFLLWMWFEERLGQIKLNIEDIVTDYGGAKMTDAELQEIYRSVKVHASSGLAMVFPRMRWSMLHFMETLAIAKPLAGGHQVCGMDRQDQLAVDLNGNVLTCQNAGAESGHKIGAVSDLKSVALNTATSYMSRPNCGECPVVHLCYGSCMFLGGDDFDSSCRSSYWHNRAMLEGVIKLLTGKEVVSISGWKPAPARRVIPLRVTT
jgi:uncharacterized protein